MSAAVLLFPLIASARLEAPKLRLIAPFAVVRGSFLSIDRIRHP